MADSTVRRDLREATLTIYDESETASVALIIGTGNVTWTVNTPNEYETDRGAIETGTVKAGDEQPLDINITCRYIDVISSGSELVTPYEAVYGIEGAAAWDSVGADPCEPFATKIEIVWDPACTGGGTPKIDETVVFAEFRPDSCAFDPDAGTLVITGKSKEVHPTVTRG